MHHLRCQKTRRKRYASGQQRRGKLCDRMCIEQRDPVVEQRSRIGDWEGDTVIGKGHRGALVTLVERKSRYTLAMQVNSKHSNGVTLVLTRFHGHMRALGFPPMSDYLSLPPEIVDNPQRSAIHDKKSIFQRV